MSAPQPTNKRPLEAAAEPTFPAPTPDDVEYHHGVRLLTAAPPPKFEWSDKPGAAGRIHDLFRAYPVMDQDIIVGAAKCGVPLPGVRPHQQLPEKFRDFVAHTAAHKGAAEAEALVRRIGDAAFEAAMLRQQQEANISHETTWSVIKQAPLILAALHACMVHELPLMVVRVNSSARDAFILNTDYAGVLITSMEATAVPNHKKEALAMAGTRFGLSLILHDGTRKAAYVTRAHAGLPVLWRDGCVAPELVNLNVPMTPSGSTIGEEALWAVLPLGVIASIASRTDEAAALRDAADYKARFGTPLPLRTSYARMMEGSPQ